MGRTLGALALMLIAVDGSPASAETATDILRRRHDLEAGSRRWTDRHDTLTMKLIGPDRDENRVVQIDSYEKRFSDGRSASIAFLRAPMDVQGTAFLGLRNPGEPARQWLYLPWSRNTRRIARPAAESFMGSDLSYGDVDLLRDIPMWSENDTTAKLLGEESEDGVRSHVIALVPKRGDIAYAQVVVWLGVSDLVARRIDLHGTETEVRKRVRQKDIRDAAGIPIPRRIEVEALGPRTRTEITVTDVRVNQGLEDAFFTQESLARGGH